MATEVNLLFPQWTSRFCRARSPPSVTPAGLRRTHHSQREETPQSFCFLEQLLLISLNLSHVDDPQGQSPDPSPERPQATFPGFRAADALDPGPAGRSLEKLLLVPEMS